MFMTGDFGKTHGSTVDHTGAVTDLDSMLYMAPEIIKNQKCAVLFIVLNGFSRYSFPCDVWSLGVILYKVCIYPNVI
jgi:serine/threonine protein kinase